MVRKYFPVLKTHVILGILLVALIIISSVTKGEISVVTSYAAGALMLFTALSFILYIVKTPSRKTKEIA